MNGRSGRRSGRRKKTSSGRRRKADVVEMQRSDVRGKRRWSKKEASKSKEEFRYFHAILKAF